MTQEHRSEEACSQAEEALNQAGQTEEAKAAGTETAGDGAAAENDAAEDTAAETQETSEDQEDSAKGGKKDSRDAQIEDLQDRLKRQMAEFDNFRKRTEKEKASMYEIGARDIIEKILPVVDNFERGLAAVPEDVKDSSFAEGVEKIYKQLMKTLEDAGVETIETVGQQFDPNLHNAVMHIDDEQYGENEICQELQKGYRYRGSVVRYSMVQVAN